MFSQLELNSIEQIIVVEKFLQYHDTFAIENIVERNHIKLFSVSSCVTRLYAIFEKFIETALSDFLDTMAECVSFELLPDGFKKEYRIGISHILSKIDQGRYSHLKHENIIKWYNDALIGDINYRFVTSALTRHEENLRLNVIFNLFNKIQLNKLNIWLEENPSVVSLYDDVGQIVTQLEAEIKNFIQLRNDASHGSLDNLEGVQNLTRLCEMVKAVIKAIASFLRGEIIQHLEKAKKVVNIGKVTETFKHNALVATLNNSVKLDVGAKLYILEKNNCDSQLITSIMVNDQNCENLLTNRDNFEVGLKLQRRLSKNAKLYLLP